MSDKKTAIIFARVGLDGTKTTEHLQKLLNQQVQDCRKFAKKCGLEVVHTFKYIGQSQHEKLVELMSLISDMENPPNELIALRLDRFSRDINRFFEFSKFLDDYGINIRMVDGEYLNSRELNSDDDSEGDMISVLPELSSPPLRLIRNMEFAIAQFDNDIKAEHVIAAMQEKFRQGYWLWKAPYGYIRAAGTNEIHVDENASKIVLDIFQQLSKSTEENRQQLIFNLAIKHKLSLVRLEKLVQNPFYVGEMYSASWDMWVTGKHKPLIDWDTWLKCQKSIK